MDYLTFGLLAGSVIVIASFLLRDAAPHLSALSPSSPLGRLSRRGAPLAWTRWCADAGLVVSAAGTAILLATVGALVADVADGVGTVVVALALAAALVAASLALARLTTRYRVDAAAERVDGPVSRPGSADPRSVAVGERTATQPLDLLPTRPAHIAAPSRALAGVDEVPGVEAEAKLWDDELPTWSNTPTEFSPSERPAPPTPSSRPAPATPNGPLTAIVEVHEPSDVDEDAVLEDEAPAARLPRSERTTRALPAVGRARGARITPTAVDPIGGEPAATVIGGSFSSPLLADIGLPTQGEAMDGFRSRLLLDLDRPMAAEPDGDPEIGSDILLDESPAPAFPSARGRDELS